MPLTDVAVRNAKPKDKPYKMGDSGGLFLLVVPRGARWWRFSYRFGGKQKTLSCGVYPEVGLGEARRIRDDARALLRQGVDPGVVRKLKRIERHAAASQGATFEAVANDWLIIKRAKLAPSYVEKIESTLKANFVNRFGGKPIADVTAQMVLDAIRVMEARGATELARRGKRYVSSVFDYAAALQLIPLGHNPSRMIANEFLAPHVTKSFPHLNADDLGEFLRRLITYHGRPETRLGLLILLHTFVRPGELRAAKWSEFDLEAGEWVVPADRTKLRRAHWVPLTPQVLQLLSELRVFTGWGEYLFPGGRGRLPYISENTFGKALKLLGYKDRVVAHGFRSTASTILNDSKRFHPDAIERQLAHLDENKIRRIYDRSEHREERRALMTWWSKHLDELAVGNVITLERKTA